MRPLRTSTPLAFLLALAAAGEARAQQETLDDLERDYQRSARRAAPRDAFPVLNDPRMVPAEEADRSMRPDDWVIGVAIGGEAKAYPVAVMGRHELANDTCAGEPIAVAW